jgi:SAM-dependent methyltransferase
MAISPLVVAWLSSLKSRGILQGGSMLEIGPSDLILYTPAAVEFYIRRHMPPDGVRAVMDALFDGQGLFRREEIGTLYRVFGYDRYRSIDLADSRADWHCDLNHPIDIPERFDMITNFGTAEHIFDIAEVFRSMHALLRPGGIQLHVMPAYGDVNHGFYNIHRKRCTAHTMAVCAAALA